MRGVSYSSSNALEPIQLSVGEPPMPWSTHQHELQNALHAVPLPEGFSAPASKVDSGRQRDTADEALWRNQEGSMAYPMTFEEGGPLALAVKQKASTRRAAADEVLGDFIRTSVPRDVDVGRVLNRKFHRTGIPVVRGWRQRQESFTPPTKAKASIAQLTEQQQKPQATVSYVHPTMTCIGLGSNNSAPVR